MYQRKVDSTATSPERSALRWRTGVALLIPGAILLAIGGAKPLGGQAEAGRPVAQGQEAGKGEGPPASSSSGARGGSGGDRPDDPQATASKRVSKIIDVISKLEEPSALIAVVPEGTWVEKGQVVGELDSTSLRDRLAYQEITIKRAEAVYENAKKTREVAEIALKEYVEGTYPLELQRAEIEDDLASEEASLARDEFDRLKQAPEPDDLATRRAGLTLKRAMVAAARAEWRLKSLKEYDKEIQVAKRQADIEKAKAEELAKLAAFKLEEQRLAKLNHLIERCQLRAPCAGVVVFPSRETGPIKAGDMIRARQSVLRVVEVNRDEAR